MNSFKKYPISPEIIDLFFPAPLDSRKFLDSLCCWLFDKVFDLLYEIMTIMKLFLDTHIWKSSDILNMILNVNLDLFVCVYISMFWNL